MKKFNKTITIEIPVDQIANQLLGVLNPEFKHRELVTEAIIGRMLNDHSLGYLYNSINGFDSSVDFRIGDTICSEKGLKVFGYWNPESDQDEYGYVKTATVISIDPYRNEKICIEFQVPSKNGPMIKDNTWVNHTEWNKIPT